MGGVHFWTKILGSALILCTGALGGKFMAARLERELEELSRFELALLNLSTEVSYSLSSLPKALLNAGHKAGGHTGALFSLIGSLCGLEQRRTVEEAFYLALEQAQGLDLPRCEIEIMTALVRNLGAWGCKEQVGFIHMALEESRNYRASIQEEYLKRARMYRSLGLLFALGIVIVLL
jgi:stage III sporulation protein AB